jgi:hypothetical protein
MLKKMMCAEGAILLLFNNLKNKLLLLRVPDVNYCWVEI